VALAGVLAGTFDLTFAFISTLYNVIGELFSHIFLFGVVIALGVARAGSADTRAPGRRAST